MLLIYGEYEENSVAAADVYNPMVDTFYMNLSNFLIYLLNVD
jgi:hypothetical protein